MAHIQNGAQMWQFITEHPIYATLAGIAGIGSPMAAVLLHPSSPIRYGRHLTPAEAPESPTSELDMVDPESPTPELDMVDPESPTPELDMVEPEPSVPGVPRIHIFYYIPHSSTYDAAQPVAIHSSYTQSPMGQVDTSHNNVQQICSLIGVLVTVIGFATLFGFILNMLKKIDDRGVWHAQVTASQQLKIIRANRHNNLLIDQLRASEQLTQSVCIAERAAQVAKQAVENELQATKNDLQTAQDALQVAEIDRSKVDSELSAAIVARIAHQNARQLLEEKLARNESSLREALNAPSLFDEKMSNQQSTFQDQQNALEAELNHLKKMHEKDLANKRSAHQQEKEESDLRLDSLKTQIRELKERHKKDIATNQSISQQEKQELMQEITRLNEQCATFQRQATEIRELKERHKKDIATNQSTFQQEKQELMQEITRLNEQCATFQRQATEIRELKERHKKDIATNQSTFQQEKQELMQEITRRDEQCATFQRQASGFEEKSKNFRQEASDIGALLKSMHKKHANALTEKDAKIASLETELKRLQGKPSATDKEQQKSTEVSETPANAGESSALAPTASIPTIVRTSPESTNTVPVSLSLEDNENGDSSSSKPLFPSPSTHSPSSSPLPPASSLLVAGGNSFSPSSALASPFVPRTALTPNNFSIPPYSNESSGGLGSSRYSPGFMSSNSGPPNTAYGTSYPPQFQDNSGGPTHMHNDPGMTLPAHSSPGFPVHDQSGSSLAPHQHNHGGSSSSPSLGRGSRPVNTTMGATTSSKRSFKCRRCKQTLPKAGLLAHVRLCKSWVSRGRQGPPPDVDRALDASG